MGKVCFQPHFVLTTEYYLHILLFTYLQPIEVTFSSSSYHPPTEIFSLHGNLLTTYTWSASSISQSCCQVKHRRTMELFWIPPSSLEKSGAQNRLKSQSLYLNLRRDCIPTLQYGCAQIYLVKNVHSKHTHTHPLLYE